MVASTTDDLDTRVSKATKQHFLQQNLNKCQQNRNYKLLSSCHRSVSLDPVRRLPMSNAERSRCICWRLGWLASGKLGLCFKHPTQHISKNHAIDCLTMHRRLFMSETIKDPLSSLMNRLPLRSLVLSGVSLF